MRVLHLSHACHDAAANMALDWCLLRMQQPGVAGVFRHYSWSRNALTFGYAQPLKGVRQKEGFEVCRRPTGGGVVDHSCDWTYALALPSDHVAGRMKPMEFYRELHQILAPCIETFGMATVLHDRKLEADPSVSVCFEHPSPDDVLCAETRCKLAGAAMKRTKQGLLIQGSLNRSLLHKVDFESLETDLVSRLCNWLGADEGAVATAVPPASFYDPEFQQVTRANWNTRR